MAVGHGGQVLVSDVTTTVARDGLPADAALVDLGEHRLRDLGEPDARVPARASRICRPSSRPCGRLMRCRGTCRVQVTTFVGRDDDVARVVALLDDASLVTLTGTGGVGKTRLAVQVAAEVVPRFADGAWFCELAAVDDGEAMAQVVSATPRLCASALVCRWPRASSSTSKSASCSSCSTTVSISSTRPVRSPRRCVRSCPKVSVLATSREALDVAGERVVRVRSLAAPDAVAPRDELIESAAVRLFADRASDARGRDRLGRQAVGGGR